MPTPTERRLQTLAAARLQLDPDQVPLDRSFRADLGLDSFDFMGLILEIEEAFAPASLSDESAAGLTTLGEVAAYLDQQLRPPATG